MEIPSTELTERNREPIDLATRSIGAVADDYHGVHSLGAAVRADDGSTYRGVDLITPREARPPNW